MGEEVKGLGRKNRPWGCKVHDRNEIAKELIPVDVNNDLGIA